MRKKLLTSTFAIAFLGLTAHAQTLTSADMPQVGDSQYYSSCDTTGVTPGASGSGVSWDYSLVTRTGGVTINYNAPAGHPQAGNYPQANLVEAYTNQQYRFLNTSADSVVLEGEKSPANTAATYTNKATLYKFPMAFGYLQVDSVHGSYPDGFISTVDRLGEYTVEVDGSGSLTTPFATYANTLRLKTLGVFFDSSYTGAADANVVTARYEWYTPGTRTPVMVLTYLSVSINGGAPQLGRDVWYADVPNSIDPSANQLGMQVYPTFADQQATVEFSLPSAELVEMEVFNALGQAVLIKNMDLGAGTHKQVMEVGHLTPGTYFVRLHADEMEQVAKFVVK